MKKKISLFTILIFATVLLSGCSGIENKEGTFYNIFVRPFEFLIEFFGDIFNGSYGMAIIAITILIRLALMPLMLKNYKNQQGMKEKMDKLKPEMDEIQKKLKETKSKEEQMVLQQEMMGLYRKHNVNPLNMGCLPMLIQMPIVMGLYFAILYSADIKSHEFLWYNLGSPDIAMTLIAGAVYFAQAKVSLWTVPEQQQQQMKLMVYISPIMIMFISFSSMAALPLYWAVGGILLIFQTYLGRKFYSNHPEKAEESV
ncbi:MULTISPECIES: membrane protein insertase YidC [unclassified Psychrobacillus]|mgnify:FL=1|uniref:membrane protein insertase YidC n=1 Tax=unclassified Psychrobacillus TaxID=2636677 RepID=UPI00146BC4A8|nr:MULTISPECIES: membrane protein insertase YidC [unclassified Psychrobacillus]MCM3357608.1 membrane protein insertase YidC [Psychrobacillus sp. MER TA 171]NME07673.1 membrane protein insertase YidC [Psychrobacillus sp. BL-248-WT-3]